jgi:hypothetical protein
MRVFWLQMGVPVQGPSPTLWRTLVPLPMMAGTGTSDIFRPVPVTGPPRLVNHVSRVTPCHGRPGMVGDFRSPPCLPKSVKKISRHCAFPGMALVRSKCGAQCRRHRTRRHACHGRQFVSVRVVHQPYSGSLLRGRNLAKRSMLRSTSTTAASLEEVASIQRWISPGVLISEMPFSHAMRRAFRSSVATVHPRDRAMARRLASPSANCMANPTKASHSSAPSIEQEWMYPWETAAPTSMS